MLKPLLIASGNTHKVREIAELLNGVPWQIVDLSAYPPVPAPVEDGLTFEENAHLKAEYYARALNVPCVADDSGIVVDALDGAPGVFSARFAGEGCTDDDNNVKLLGLLKDVPDEARTARFVCCSVFVDLEGNTHAARGTVEGRIDYTPRGQNGFGYDPLFIPVGYQQSFGELDASIKARISHRSRAFTQMRDFLAARP
ncbi:MAG: RdgB/HAM1 family non-canonical purine NTP pyrophosphatase [Candidatus Hydrogenedentes bacterium]|nr:RdgB/HAM1 family non-canonical purine NTP pyrophosphatase [Candidatus Hydrogenedentota bacterium]